MPWAEWDEGYRVGVSEEKLKFSSIFVFVCNKQNIPRYEYLSPHLPQPLSAVHVIIILGQIAFVQSAVGGIE